MMKIPGKKSKSTQYLVGGVVAVIILIIWISSPLMNNSSLDSSVDSGNFFKTKTADVSSLGNDIPSEGGAPGYSLSGEMLNNPATSGESIASSLFQSGPEDETAPAASASDLTDGSGLAAPSPRASASAPAPSPDSQGSKGKLSSLPSITGGNANSVTTGGAHNKFFGAGAANARPELTPLQGQPLNKNAAPADKRNALVAALQKTEDRSAQAARSPNLNESRGGSAGAFERTGKADTSDLNSGLERGAASSGLALGAAAQDLKRSDPQLNKSKVSLPEPKPVKDDKGDEEIKKMIIQMLISSVLGPMFGSVFGLPAATVPPVR